MYLSTIPVAASFYTILSAQYRCEGEYGYKRPLQKYDSLEKFAAVSVGGDERYSFHRVLPLVR